MGRVRARRRGNSGIALVLTLLAVAIITAMVVEFSYDVYVDTSILYNWRDSQKLSFAAKSAVRLGPALINEMITLNGYFPASLEISEKIPFPGLDGTVTLHIENENAKFNLRRLVNQPNGILNDYGYNSFVRLLRALHLKTELADRIVYWINPLLEPELKSPENIAKGANPDSIDELLLVPGMDEKSYERLRPYVTIYGNGSVDINSADIPVLLSLSPDVDEGMAESLIRYRKGTPFVNTSDIKHVMGFENLQIQLNQDTNLFFPLVCVQGDAFRIIATAQSGQLKRIVDSVVNSSGEVLYWKEM